MSNAKSKWNMLCNVSTDVLHVLFTQKIKKIEEHSVTLANHAPLPPNFQPIFLRKVERFWDLKMPKDPLRKVLRFKYVERSTTRKKGQKGSSRAENVLWPCSCICNFCRFLSDALQFSLFSSHFYSAFLFLPFPKHFFNTFQQSVPQFFFLAFPTIYGAFQLISTKFLQFPNNSPPSIATWASQSRSNFADTSHLFSSLVRPSSNLQHKLRNDSASFDLTDSDMFYLSSVSFSFFNTSQSSRLQRSITLSSVSYLKPSPM